MPNLDNRSSLVEGGDGAPSTPMSQVVMIVGRSDINDEGQWTPAVNKKKKKNKVSPRKEPCGISGG
jgi:hypothetical protein